VLIAMMLLVAIMLPIDIISVIVLIAFCWQISADLIIPDNIWVDKRAAIARQVVYLGF
jgi:hypothetical protein